MKKILLVLFLMFNIVILFVAAKPINDELLETQQQKSAIKIVSPFSELELEIKKCKWNDDNTVTIDFLLTNNSSNDVELTLYGIELTISKTISYDDEGNVYSNIEVGMFRGSTVSRRINNVSFPSEVPIKCRMKIKGVDSSASMLKRVNLEVSMAKVGKKIFQISNLPIEKS